MSSRVTPYTLIYVHDTVLPMEVRVWSLRFASRIVILDDYNRAMIIELEDLDEQSLVALDKLQAPKAKVARTYNKKVKFKAF